eukprot:m.429384 g.429384  ORF g.429384 m.429384 type:complete len:53 (+) comp56716_c0_seq2:80-238(+)
MHTRMHTSRPCTRTPALHTRSAPQDHHMVARRALQSDFSLFLSSTLPPSLFL